MEASHVFERYADHYDYQYENFCIDKITCYLLLEDIFETSGSLEVI